MLLIAHRGSSARLPENSIAAFRAAMNDRADGIETDVRLSLDGVPVLSHDDDVARAPGVPMLISRTGRADLTAALASLAELLELAAGRIALYLELKPWRDGDDFRSADVVARAVAPMVKDLTGIVVSSFDPGAVEMARLLLPNAATALGVLEGADPSWAVAAARRAGHEQIHVHESGVDARLVAQIHAAGLRVLAYTVNDPSRLREMRSLGVDGVFTDDPRAACAALTENR